MVIQYTCPSCNSKRYFTSTQDKEVLCVKCNTKMETRKGGIAIKVESSEEARFMGDEALFNTLGNRISGKHTNLTFNKGV